MANLWAGEHGLYIELSTAEKFGALRGDLEIPWEAVVGGRRVAVALAERRGWRAPGTAWPGSIALGTWRRREGKSFVAAYRDEPGYVLELEGQRFDEVVISTPSVIGLDEHLAQLDASPSTTTDRSAGEPVPATPEARDPEPAEPAQPAREPESGGAETAELASLSKSELYRLAQERDLPGRSSMSKAELLAALGDDQPS